MTTHMNNYRTVIRLQPGEPNGNSNASARRQMAVRTYRQVGVALGLSSERVRQIEREAWESVRRLLKRPVERHGEHYREELLKWATLADVLSEEGLAEEAAEVRACAMQFADVLDSARVAV